MSHKGRVAVICGSYRNGLTHLVMKQAEAIALTRGLEAEFLCARDLALPIFDPPETDNHPNVRRWREAVRRADGIIVCSPEYHGAFSGALKNMIDYLDFSHIEHKPVALLATTGSVKTGIGALNAMRLVFRALHAPAIVEQVAFWGGDLNSETGLLNAEALSQLTKVIDGMVRVLSYGMLKGAA